MSGAGRNAVSANQGFRSTNSRIVSNNFGSHKKALNQELRHAPRGSRILSSESFDGKTVYFNDTEKIKRDSRGRILSVTPNKAIAAFGGFNTEEAVSAENISIQVPNMEKLLQGLLKGLHSLEKKIGLTSDAMQNAANTINGISSQKSGFDQFTKEIENQIYTEIKKYY